MACPSCGGSRRRELAAGLYQCLETHTALLPNALGPQFGPERREYACGATYQDVPSNATLGLCHICRSYGAIAICTHCEKPVDAMHARLSYNGAECDRCVATIAARDAAQTREKQAAAAHAAAEERQRRKRLLDATPRMSLSDAVTVVIFEPWKSTYTRTWLEVESAARTLRSAGPAEVLEEAGRQFFRSSNLPRKLAGEYWIDDWGIDRRGRFMSKETVEHSGSRGYSYSDSRTRAIPRPGGNCTGLIEAIEARIGRAAANARAV